MQKINPTFLIIYKRKSRESSAVHKSDSAIGDIEKCFKALAQKKEDEKMQTRYSKKDFYDLHLFTINLSLFLFLEMYDFC